jgi:hypothetical protein
MRLILRPLNGPVNHYIRETTSQITVNSNEDASEAVPLSCVEVVLYHRADQCDHLVVGG